MYSKFLKICSLALTIAILISLLPAHVLGAEIEDVESISSDMVASSDAIESLSDVTETNIQSNAKIVGEIVEGRTEYSKEYLMSNGLNLVVIYPEAVHYKKDNAWEEIDNTLRAVGTSSNARYTNTAGEWTVSFPQQINSNQCVNISRDDYTLSFGLAGELRTKKNEHAMLKSAASNNTIVDKEAELNLQSTNSATAIIEERDLTTLRESMEYPETFVSSVFSRMKYDNVYNNTDVVYDLDANSVKESIVINAFNPDLYGYRYTLSTGGMVPVLQDDGSILLYNAARTEVIMTMPAPFMVDNAGETTSDVRVSLVANGTEYLLTYYVPVTWLADENRTWPVILDPVVEAGTSVNNILDHFVAEYYSESSGSGALMCGYDPDFGKMRTFIKFSEIPDLAAADIIVNATLSLTYLGGSSNTTRIGAHKVNANWETGTITWSNQPEHNNIVEDYAGVTGSGRYSWHVTDIARSWYETGNTGIMLKALESIENGTTENWKKFYSVDYSTYNTERWPSLTITYRNSSGIESYWDYTTVSAGRAGSGYINNCTGNLTWTHTDLGFDGNRMPVSISHVYNVDDCDTNLFGLGYGWKTNYHQTIQLSESEGYYIWLDGDGTKHELVPGTETDTYVDQEGLCLTLTISTNNTTSPYTITDKYGNTSVFDLTGRLVKLVNNQETQSRIEITYIAGSNRIDTILDGVGRRYKFTYNSSNLLTKISYYGTDTSEITNVQFSYSSYENLVKITYKDSLDSHFNYSVHHLTAATDVDDSKIAFSYFSGSAKRITQTQEYDGTTAGNCLTFEYARNKVKISDTQHTQIRYFNDFGNLISCQDNEGNAEFYQYAANRHNINLSHLNELTLSSKLQNTVVNLMEHSSFETGSSWTMTSLASSTRTEARAYMSGHSLLVTTDSSGICAYAASVAIPANETLTLSAYVQAVNTSVQLGLGTTTTASSVSEIQKSGSAWTRIEVSYTNNSSSSVSVRPLLILNGAGSVYLDCVQVELSGGASRYNLIENGDFRTANIWSSSAGRLTTTSASSCMNNTVYKITGNPDTDKSIYQTIRINGNADDVFVLAGWGKGNPLPLTNQDPLENGAPAYGLRADFLKNNALVNSCFVGFDPASCNSGDWQYAADRIVANGAYDAIRVYLVYNRNPNSVYFDGIQLYKEEFGERYTYDSNRNVTSVTDILGQETKYGYNETNDLTSVTEPSGSVTTNSYSYHNLTKSVQSHTQEGRLVPWASYSYSYDTYGNQLRAYSEVDRVVKQTCTSYSDDNNYISTTTDELGNITTYEYDLQTGMLLAVMNPEDDGSSKTTYTYDSLYRLQTTRKVIGQGITMLVQNYYNGNKLSDITTPSTTYNFEYGAFDLLKEVAIGRELDDNTGGICLARYTYTDDVYRNIKTIDYGNQDRVQYTYDDLGRMIQETYYENGSTIASRTVTYEYNNSSALAARVDSETDVTTKYYYDTTGRTTDVYESGGSSIHRIRYTYDEFGRLQKSEETCGTPTYSTEYIYYGNGQIQELKSDNSTETYAYDEYGRLDKWYTYHNHSSTYLILKNVHYEQPDDRSTSSLPSVWSYTSTGGYRINYNYAYDDNGNIISETVDGKTTTYVYDSANQLIRENNQKAGKTWVWTYDAAGNILSKKEYAYTTGTLGSVQNTITYSYGDDNWGDLLTKHGDARISYDVIGNPLNYGAEQKYTWEQGRQLSVLMQATDFAFAKHPENFVGQIGDRVTFTVAVRGAGPFTYQWQVSINGGATWSSTTAGGSTTASMYLYMNENSPGYLYRCKVTNANGKVIYSHPGKISSVPIVVATRPADFYGTVGDIAIFQVTARGTDLTYQWQVSSNYGASWSNSTASGCTSNAMLLTVNSYHDGYYYRCKIMDSAGNVAYSEPGKIHITELAVVDQPQDVTAKVGDLVIFSIEAYGTGLTYQWQVSSNRGLTWYDSSASGNQTQNISLTVQSHHPGYFYRCKVTDSAGNVVYSEPGEVLLPMEQWRHTYNADGLRTQRTNGTVTYEYTYHGNQLTHMVYNGTELHFTYDANGGPLSVLYNDDVFYYVLNLQGDVVAILDSAGIQVVTYTYDAWGRLLSTDDDSECNLGQLNPLLYRGYVYDRETGLYYLQSRYYNPTWGRFLNADNLINLENLWGSNMFAYCCNNPVHYEDTTGHWVETVFDLISLGISVVEVVINPADPWAWAGLAGDALDLIPFVTGLGEGVKGMRVVAKGADLADDALTTVRFAKAADFTDDAIDTIKTLDKAGDFTQSTAAAGRRIHKGYKVFEDGKEFAKIPGIRMDVFDGKNVFELKPYNKNGLHQGVNQLIRYSNKIDYPVCLILEFY